MAKRKQRAARPGDPTAGPKLVEGISLQGAVRVDGKPFVVVYVDGEPYGQLTPREALQHGTRAIQAAIEAERDAAVVLACLEQAAGEGKSAEQGERMAGYLLDLTRRHRGQADPDPAVDVRPSSRPRSDRDEGELP